MTIVACDLHTRKQQVAVLDTDTGEITERELLHEGGAVEQFYRALPRPVTVGIESTGYALWFHELMQELGHTLLVGEPAKIRAAGLARDPHRRAGHPHRCRRPGPSDCPQWSSLCSMASVVARRGAFRYGF